MRTYRPRGNRAKTDEKAIEYVKSVGGYVCYFDGCCEPVNPGGTAGYGGVIYQGEERVHQTSGMIPPGPETSNNVAEYCALDSILGWFIENGKTEAPIIVLGDSNLVIQQCFGTWKIRTKEAPYAKHALMVMEKMQRFKNLRGTWISRTRNGEADDLSKAHLRANKVEFRIQPETQAASQP